MAGAWNFDEWIDDMKQLAPGYYVKAGDVYAVKTQNSFVFTTNNSSITFEPSDQNYPLHLYTPVVRQRLLAENPEGAAFATFESLVEVLQRAGNAGRGEEIRCLNEGIMSVSCGVLDSGLPAYRTFAYTLIGAAVSHQDEGKEGWPRP